MILQITGVISTILMAIAFIVTIVSLVNEDDTYKRKAQILEAIILFTAFCFYMIIMRQNRRTHSLSIIRLRFFDWALTTPLMLIVLILIYPRGETTKPTPVVVVCIMTIVMVIVGLLFNQHKLLWKFGAASTGFVLLVAIFVIIYKSTGVAQAESQAAFWYTVVIWTMYGFAYFMPFYVRNVIYNILDMLAKSVFGLLLATNVFNIQKPIVEK
jgi:bacteriorhodopsin